MRWLSIIKVFILFNNFLLKTVFAYLLKQATMQTVSQKGEILIKRITPNDFFHLNFNCFGKVHHRWFFEGLVFVLIDNTGTYEDEKGNQVPVKPLSRMLYLQTWDNYVPATFRGAPPVCYYCRQVRHIRSKCPILANKECYRCGHLGHTARVCKEKE